MHLLLSTIKHYQDKPFQWGRADCCIFACDCIKAQTGIDLMKCYVTLYDSEISAKKSLIKYGSIGSHLDKYFSRIDNELAKRGDAILCASPLGNLLAINWIGGVFAMTKDGCRIIENPERLITWSIK